MTLRTRMLVPLAAMLLLMCNRSFSTQPTEHQPMKDKESTLPATFGQDVSFFKKHHVETIVLEDRGSGARVLLVPAYQGRVMTSTAGGEKGSSYGWINYGLISSGKTVEHMNPYGGEERFWLGPEGGPFSVFFKAGVPQEFAHWQVPAVLDTKPFAVVSHGGQKAVFSASFRLPNASGSTLSVGVKRTVRLLAGADVQKALGLAPDASVRWVAYESDNVITNTGTESWTTTTGMPSIWMLSMLNPSPEAVVAIPYKGQEAPGTILTDDYFGKVPPDRLTSNGGIIYFKTDGKKRSKIGVSPRGAREYAASYDPRNHLLTLLWCTPPRADAPYVNSKWGAQTDPFAGDAINSYNDGPLDDGSQMGPFYEIETSSPAAALKPGASLQHVQRMFHFEGGEEALSVITKATIGITVRQIAEAFK